MALTAVLVKNARPGPKHYALADGDGLYLRVYPTGKRAFAYRYKVDERTYWVSLGEYPALTLADARAKAGAYALMRKQGGDPALEAAKAKRAARLQIVEARLAKTFGELCEEYYRREIVPQYKRPEEVRRMLDNDVLPILGGYPLAEIQRKHLGAALDKVLDRGAKVRAKRVLDVLKRIGAYAVSRGYLEHSPAAAIERRKVGGKENPRQRDLSWDEIRELWTVLDTMEPRPLLTWQVRACVKWLMLTGQRIGETLAAEWADVDLEGREWRIPAGNTKSGRAHLVHISDALAELIEWIKPYSEGGRWVFAGERASGKQFSEDSVSFALRRLFADGKLTMEPFRPHDLRRTFASRVSDAPLSVPPHIVEKLLNHRMQGLLERYNKAAYLPERQAALQAWGRHLMVQVGAAEARENVVTLTRRGQL